MAENRNASSTLIIFVHWAIIYKPNLKTKIKTVIGQNTINKSAVETLVGHNILGNKEDIFIHLQYL
jgi:hypothetical protein